MFHPSSEEQLILSLLRPDLPEGKRKETDRDQRDRPIDYGRVLELARLSLIAPLLYRRLERAQGFPQAVIDELRKDYFTTFHRNALHCRETLRIVGLLHSVGVAAIPIKGSLASDIILGDMGLYPTGDIDLLVRPSDLEEAKKVLNASGFCGYIGLREEDLLESSYHLVLGNGSYLVEVHWNLVKWFFEAPADFWWEDALTIEYEGLELTLLSPERYLLYCIFHLFTHRFRPLKFFLLVRGLMDKYRKEIEWDKVLVLAGRIRMRRLTLFTLRLMRDLLGTDVPDSITSEKIVGYSLLKKIVLSGLFRDMTRSYVRLAFLTTLLDGPWDMAKVLFGRIFPPVSEIRLRYSLPAGSGKVFAYYLLNPIFLLFRKSR